MMKPSRVVSGFVLLVATAPQAIAQPARAPFVVPAWAFPPVPAPSQSPGD
jgi:hypothetical protein